MIISIIICFVTKSKLIFVPIEYICIYTYTDWNKGGYNMIE